MKNLALLLSLAAAAIAPASAHAQNSAYGSVYVDVSGHEHWRPAPAWAPLTGPQIYYGTHFTQVPAYPEPDLSHAYPVPVFYGPRPLPIISYGVSSHEAWCQARYRSYRAYDNTFQPYHGQRRECRSPYY